MDTISYKNTEKMRIWHFQLHSREVAFSRRKEVVGNVYLVENQVSAIATEWMGLTVSRWVNTCIHTYIKIKPFFKLWGPNFCFQVSIYLSHDSHAFCLPCLAHSPVSLTHEASSKLPATYFLIFSFQQSMMQYLIVLCLEQMTWARYIYISS